MCKMQDEDHTTLQQQPLWHMSPTLVPYTSGQLLKLPPGTKNLQNNQPVTNGF
jgi:hypothetical protein